MKTVIKICLWFIVFVPLIVDNNVFFPFVSGKNLLIESCLVLAGILILFNFFYSKSFREEIIEKATKYIKHPLVIAILAFISIFIISTVFAVDKYSAFWGNLNRAEGLAGMMFFFAFFVFTLLTFERKDWLWFFKLSLFTTFILLGKEFTEYFNGVVRPGSFTGNPTFLAGYLLFSISTSLIVLSSSKDWFFRYLSIITIILSVVGIFIAETRGTILGLGLGIIVALIYSVFKGKNINYKVFNLRKTAIILLSIGIIFSGVFFVTRENKIWQKVPGLSRVAVINTNGQSDTSTSVRFYLYQTALKSVDPIQNGWRKLLLGWGPENYALADSKYYNPDLYKYEVEWHDRAHNKLLDVLVMNGLLGLLSYLAVWILLFRYILKQKEFSFVSVGLLTFGVSYLVHLMFVFDQISTSVPFFAVLALVVYLSLEIPSEAPKKALISNEIKEKYEILTGTLLVILGVFLAFVYFKSTLLGYVQMRNYTSIIKAQNPITIEKEIDSVLTPFTLTQVNIRRNFMEVADNLNNKNPSDITVLLLKKSATVGEEYIKDQPLNFGFMVTLANFYNYNTTLSTNQEFLKRGEELFNIILSHYPNRPDINFGLAINLFNQKKYADSFAYFEKSFNLYPGYFANDPKKVEFYYASFVKYLYEQKDKDNFLIAANRLKLNNYPGAASLDKILEYLNMTGTWPKVNFK